MLYPVDGTAGLASARKRHRQAQVECTTPVTILGKSVFRSPSHVDIVLNDMRRIWGMRGARTRVRAQRKPCNARHRSSCGISRGTPTVTFAGRPVLFFGPSADGVLAPARGCRAGSCCEDWRRHVFGAGGGHAPSGALGHLIFFKKHGISFGKCNNYD